MYNIKEAGNYYIMHDNVNISLIIPSSYDAKQIGEKEESEEREKKNYHVVEAEEIGERGET